MINHFITRWCGAGQLTMRRVQASSPVTVTRYNRQNSELERKKYIVGMYV